MEILTTRFVCGFKGEPIEAGLRWNEAYMFHPLNVSNKIIINNKGYKANYSTGNSFSGTSFYGADYYCPRNVLELDDFGTHRAILIVASLEKKDLRKFKDGNYVQDNAYIDNILEQIKNAGCEAIKDMQDIIQLINYLNDEENKPNFRDYVSG